MLQQLYQHELIYTNKSYSLNLPKVNGHIYFRNELLNLF